MTAHLIVRAHMADSGTRKDFDHWYEHEHLPDARSAFKANRAWRGWSSVDPDVHYAFYEFDDVAAALSISQSDEIAALIEEFDRIWGERVVRTRDVVEVSQHLAD